MLFSNSSHVVTSNTSNSSRAIASSALRIYLKCRSPRCLPNWCSDPLHLRTDTLRTTPIVHLAFHTNVEKYRQCTLFSLHHNPLSNSYTLLQTRCKILKTRTRPKLAQYTHSFTHLLLHVVIIGLRQCSLSDHLAQRNETLHWREAIESKEC